MNQQLNSQQSQAIMAQWLQAVVGVVMTLAVLAMVIAEVVKKIKEAAKS